MPKTTFPVVLELSSLNEIMNVKNTEAVIFNRYFSHIEASTLEFQEAILPFLNSNWDKNSEHLIAKLLSLSDKLEKNIYRECILATKNYINSRDFIAPNRYETTSYLFGAIQYQSESEKLKDLNQKLDQLIENIPQKNTSWSESFENLWCKTASTLFSAFDFAKENPIATIAALLYGQTVLAAAFPAVFNLSSLDGTNGFKINGVAAGDWSGVAVSSAGDVNKDGYTDLIVGAIYAVPGGKSYVIFSKEDPWTTPFELSTLNGINGFIINGGTAAGECGISVSFAGDINGDGIDDLIIGAHVADKSYVIFGKDETWLTSLDLSTLDGVNGFKIISEGDNNYNGRSVSSAGDINGDGINDLIIGAPEADPNDNANAGASYVLFGKKGVWATPFELSTLNGTNGFKINGEIAGDFSGWSVSFAGDINGDGIDDLIIGASNAAHNGENKAGSSYLIFGKNETWATPFELSSLNGTNGFKINGEATYDLSGTSVSSGDINGDGINDLIIGAYWADPNEKNKAGSSYVIFGKRGNWTTPLELSSLNGTNGFKINGEVADDYSGWSVSFAGDINSDGYSDLIIGAYGANSDGKNETGSSYVIFGKSGPWITPLELSTLNGITGFKINGETTGDRSGYSVNSAGDINNDGYDDLIIGAYKADPNGGNEAGSSYVVFGNKVVPVLAGSGGSISYTENIPVIIDSNITINSLHPINSAAISITNNFNLFQDDLNFINQNGITGLYNSATGVLTLSGAANTTNYQIALQSIKYNNLSDDPIFSIRTISFMVNDGHENSIGITREITIIPVNDAPIVTLSGSALSYTENEGAKAIDPNANVVDPDNVNLVNATISIISNFNAAEDRLSFTDQNGITGFYNDATGVLILTGISNVANYQTALRDIYYENLSDNPTTDPRMVSFVVSDGSEDSMRATRNINIIVNDINWLLWSGITAAGIVLFILTGIANQLYKKLNSCIRQDVKRDKTDTFANLVQKRLRLDDVGKFDTIMGREIFTFIQGLKEKLFIEEINANISNNELDRLCDILVTIIRKEFPTVTAEYYIPFIIICLYCCDCAIFKIPLPSAMVSYDCCGLANSKLSWQDINKCGEKEKSKEIANEILEQYKSLVYKINVADVEEKKIKFAEFDKNNCGDNALLLLTALNGYKDMFDCLCQLKGSNDQPVFELTYTNNCGNNALLAAAIGGHIEMFDYLLKKYPAAFTLADKDRNGNNALLAAAIGGHIKMFDYLYQLKRGSYGRRESDKPDDAVIEVSDNKNTGIEMQSFKNHQNEKENHTNNDWDNALLDDNKGSDGQPVFKLICTNNDGNNALLLADLNNHGDMFDHLCQLRGSNDRLVFELKELDDCLVSESKESKTRPDAINNQDEKQDLKTILLRYKKNSTARAALNEEISSNSIVRQFVKQKSQVQKLYSDSESKQAALNKESASYMQLLKPRPEEKLFNRQININRWYQDNDISTYVDAAVRPGAMGGYAPNCHFLLRGIGLNELNTFPEECTEEKGSEIRFYAAVTPAVDAQEQASAIDFYLDKTKQPQPVIRDEQKDVFDELQPIIQLQDNYRIKILFPYNRTQSHWLTGEIQIIKQLNRYMINILAHDPYGGGCMEEPSYEQLKATIEKRLKEIDFKATCEFNKCSSSYMTRRQAENDGVSCGVIVAEEIIKRIEGQSLDLLEPYNYGARLLREKQLNCIEKTYQENDLTRINFVNRNTIPEQVDSVISKVPAIDTIIQNLLENKMSQEKINQTINHLIELNGQVAEANFQLEQYLNQQFQSEEIFEYYVNNFYEKYQPGPQALELYEQLKAIERTTEMRRDLTEESGKIPEEKQKTDSPQKQNPTQSPRPS